MVPLRHRAAAASYKTVHEPRIDGFWSEESRGQPQGQASSGPSRATTGAPTRWRRSCARRSSRSSPGKLTITPMESEVAQVDFFGRALRTQRLKAEPVIIEALPLPIAGRPAGFDRGQRGQVHASRRAVDRNKVAVGEAVTVNVAVSGQGNLRKLAPPRLPKLEGWKSLRSQGRREARQHGRHRAAARPSSTCCCPSAPGSR